MHNAASVERGHIRDCSVIGVLIELQEMTRALRSWPRRLWLIDVRLLDLRTEEPVCLTFRECTRCCPLRSASLQAFQSLLQAI